MREYPYKIWEYKVRGIKNLFPLQWRHNESYGVLNNQPHDCLLNRLLRHRSKKTPKLRATGPCEGTLVNSPHKGPVIWEKFPLDDVFMQSKYITEEMISKTWVLYGNINEG